MGNQTKQSWNGEFDSLIEEHHAIFKRDAIVEAHSLSQQTDIQKDAVENHARGIQARYHGLLAKIKSKIQGATAKAHSLLDKEHAEMEIGKNNETTEKLKEEIRVDEADLRRIHLAYDWSHYHLRILVEALFFFGEVSINSYAFAVLGGALLFAILPALLFSVCLSLAAFFIPRHVKSMPERADRIRTGFAYASLMFAVLLAIGILRSIAALGNGSFHSLGSGSVMTGAVIFTLLNYFIFCCSMILAWGLPNKEDRMAKQNHDRLTKRIAAAKKEVTRLERDNRSIATMVNANKRGHIQTVGEESHYENLINQYCRDTVHSFFSEFNLKRPKGGDFFLNSPNNL